MSADPSDLQAALQRLARARDDEPAWKVLHRHLWPYVMAIAFRESRGRAADAEDSAQETLLRLARYATFEELQDPAALRAYVGTIARRVVRDRLARERRREEGRDGGAPGGPETVARAPLFPEHALERARSFLDPEELALFALLLEGADVGQVAARLEIRYGTAAVRIHRLRMKLRKSL